MLGAKTFGIQMLGVMIFGIHMFELMTIGILFTVRSVMTFGIQMFGMMTVRINCSSEDALNSNVCTNDFRNSCLQ